MRVVLQRVKQAKVTVAGTTVGEIGSGLLLLVGFGQGDTAAVAAPLATKIAQLRVFPDAHGRPHFSIVEHGGDVLAVSQFTLYGDCTKGRRPDFFGALGAAEAAALFEDFKVQLRAAGVRRVESGEFGALMEVSLVNDGPFTLVLEHKPG